MVRKLGKNGIADEFQIEGPSSGDESISLEDLPGDLAGVSISLRYYRKQAECFSKWGTNDLRKFSALIDKLRNHNAGTLAGSKLCSAHKGPPAQAKFALPDSLSPDLTLYELRVDQSNKARIHGVLWGETFFLVWLDRNHAVFPE
uniref:hypothetical protein n=1 Tax=uncultured Erythrobacter sp. TaxID=263913 RepID=UPI00261D7B0C|nr:hypothetical protein [uncultured Erythrobacter sp.]